MFNLLKRVGRFVAPVAVVSVLWGCGGGGGNTVVSESKTLPITYSDSGANRVAFTGPAGFSKQVAGAGGQTSQSYTFKFNADETQTINFTVADTSGNALGSGTFSSTWTHIQTVSEIDITWDGSLMNVIWH